MTKIRFIPHEKNYESATKTSRFILFREASAFYCPNHTKHKCTLWTEYRVLVSQSRWYVNNNHWTLTINLLGQQDEYAKNDDKDKQAKCRSGVRRGKGMKQIMACHDITNPSEQNKDERAAFVTILLIVCSRKRLQARKNLVIFEKTSA
jgi:hypothetical protein